MLFNWTSLFRLDCKVHSRREFYVVCRGLCFQRGAGVFTSKTKNNQHLLNANRHLETATRLCDSGKMSYLDLSGDPLLTARLPWLLRFIKLRNTTNHHHVPDSDPKSSHPEFVTRAKQWDSNRVKKFVTNH